ncbi:hypothetical protein HYH03_003548 [Edaphochlamys debaryana]|uniref:Ankyrin repeat domain-containing protein n=1 Tax=Edaphochlamys debaryana TaxID=47281 RepID=A0A835Y8M1_9CHLO|nr:hypothetical protein HYH03_003548 [Edaphochlamys debaryana]|eukprot:KAG2498287.1 hypothetical protein HYH03_003548 [Edaphochlamys debaryana]
MSCKRSRRTPVAEPEPSPVSADDAASVWTNAIVQNVASFLPSNEVACLRLVNKATAEQFRGHARIRLSQPVPPWAFTERWSAPGSCKQYTREQQEKLVSLVAASGVVANLAVALAATGRARARQEDLEAAAEAGTLDMCKHLVGPGRLVGAVLWPEVLHAAARGGHRLVCEWCLEAGEHIGPTELGEAAIQAATAGHAALMDWLLVQIRSKLRPGTEPYDPFELAEAVVEGCDFATVQHLWQDPAHAAEMQGLQGHDHEDLLSAALRSRGPDWQAKAEWLMAAHGLALDSGVFYEDAVGLPAEAALERYEWLKGRGCAPDDEAVEAAVESGNAAAVGWLLAQGLRPAIVPVVLGEAAHAGHLGVLQAVHGAGLEINFKEVAIEAASGGRLAVLTWAVGLLRAAQRGNFLEDTIMTAAAEGGCLECMRWLAERGADMEDDAWPAAVSSGCEAAVELLVELGCPKPTDGRPYGRAVEEHEWAMLPLLRRLEVPLGRVKPKGLFLAAAQGGAPLRSLQWLVAEFGVPEWGVLTRAAGEAWHAGGQPEVLAWIKGLARFTELREARDECHQWEDIDDDQQLMPYAVHLAALKGCGLATVKRLGKLVGPLEDEDLDAALGAALRCALPDWPDKAAWLLSLGARPQPSHYAAPAKLPGPEALQRYAWLQSEGCAPDPADDHTVLEVVRNGNGPALEWLLAAGVRPDPSGKLYDNRIHVAACSSHLGVLQALKAAGCSGLDPKKLMGAAAGGGHLELMAWVYEEFDWGDDAALSSPGLFSAAVDGQPYERAILENEWGVMRPMRAAGLDFGPTSVGVRNRDLYGMACREHAPSPVRRWLEAERFPGAMPRWSGAGEQAPA